MTEISVMAAQCVNLGIQNSHIVNYIFKYSFYTNEYQLTFNRESIDRETDDSNLIVETSNWLLVTMRLISSICKDKEA